MHIGQTYRRDTAAQIAERLRNNKPGTPVYRSTAAEDDRRYEEQRRG